VDIRVQAFGSCAFLMLTVILSIGPLTRLDRRFLPLLYNRRHLGVLTFLVVCAHALFMVEWYAVQNSLPDIVTELTTWPDYGKFIGFPFKVLGIIALLILFLLASTSHDFWLGFFTPPVWKGLHMALYAAYGLVVMHVALGMMQFERTALVPVMLIGGFGTVALLHLLAGSRERAADRGVAVGNEGWIAVGTPQSIPDKCARIVTPADGERIAVFRDGDHIGALTNLCAHQYGPLGEGRIIDGCVTCPWHGFQYRLEDGRAPPPFTEVLATYPVRLRDGIVEVDPRPLPPGTPAAIDVIL
jgi:nitrite reductase/ring-hydroxylating ferredoxin subunit/DMSO/TMAO reductase YedYZ heme-binding membrane subunit